MKPLLIILLLLAIAALFFYAAWLDGVIAFADNRCEFCEFLETHRMEEDAHRFAMNIREHPMFELEYQFQLAARARHGAKGEERWAFATIKTGIPLNFCPACGKPIEKEFHITWREVEIYDKEVYYNTDEFKGS